MIRYVLASAALMMAAAGPASAQSIEWRGGLIVTNANASCIEDGWEVGDYMTARYRPPNIGSNGPYTRLATITSAGAHGFILSGDVGTSFKPTLSSAEIVSGPNTFGPGFHKVRFTARSPKTMAANTASVVITGQIAGFGSVQDCTITFRATLGLRP